MKVAVPEWQGRVSPVFDVAEQLLVVELDCQLGGGRVMESLGRMASHDRVRRLAELGVDVLVCGAISWPLEALLTAGGIHVVPLVCGDVDEVVQAYREGALDEERFAMPGCCGKRRHGRQCRHRGGGRTAEDTP